MLTIRLVHRYLTQYYLIVVNRIFLWIVLSLSLFVLDAFFLCNRYRASHELGFRTHGRPRLVTISFPLETKYTDTGVESMTVPLFSSLQISPYPWGFQEVVLRKQSLLMKKLWGWLFLWGLLKLKLSRLWKQQWVLFCGTAGSPGATNLTFFGSPSVIRPSLLLLFYRSVPLIWPFLWFEGLGYFTVVWSLTWTMNASEAGVDLVLIQTYLFLTCKCT